MHLLDHSKVGGADTCIGPGLAEGGEGVRSRRGRKEGAISQRERPLFWRKVHQRKRREERESDGGTKKRDGTFLRWSAIFLPPRPDFSVFKQWKLSQGFRLVRMKL